MLKFLKKILRFSNIRITYNLAAFKFLRPAFYFQNYFNMAGDSSKTKSDLMLDENPVKKIKLSVDMSTTRTVATMCGAWRPDEEDGGMILVFKTRQPCLSPDPEKESEYPENIEDFWEAGTNDDQVSCDLLISFQYIFKKNTDLNGVVYFSSSKVNKIQFEIFFHLMLVAPSIKLCMY